MLELKNVKKTYNNVTPIKNIDAHITKGEIVVIMGRSGTGKTTLLRCIDRLEELTDGSITVDGVDIFDPNCNLLEVHRDVGFVFQTFNLYENLTVEENITVGLTQIRHKSKEEAKKIALELLARVSMQERANAYPYQLSGGQKQRVAIVRTLAMEPKVVLMDEPTSALDPSMTLEISEIIKSFAEKGITFIITSHDLDFVSSVATRIFYLDEGIIYEDGPAEKILNNPSKEKTRNFVNRINSFNYTIQSGSFDLYKLLEKIMPYLASKKFELSKMNAITLILEETIMNQILANVTGKDAVILLLTITDKNTINLKFEGLDYFDFDLKNSNEFSDMILSKYMVSKNFDPIAKKVEYVFNI